jgi:hypothetical protein
MQKSRRRRIGHVRRAMRQSAGRDETRDRQARVIVCGSMLRIRLSIDERRGAM